MWGSRDLKPGRGCGPPIRRGVTNDKTRLSSDCQLYYVPEQFLRCGVMTRTGCCKLRRSVFDQCRKTPSGILLVPPHFNALKRELCEAFGVPNRTQVSSKQLCRLPLMFISLLHKRVKLWQKALMWSFNCSYEVSRRRVNRQLGDVGIPALSPSLGKCQRLLMSEMLCAANCATLSWRIRYLFPSVAQ